MWSNNFNSHINPLPTHQILQFPSPIPQALPLENNPPNFPQLEPSNPIIYQCPPYSLYSPDDEKILGDEVIYLHSLWHRGPPSALNPQTPHYLKPSIPTPFKRSKIPSKTLNSNLVSDKEWPIESKPKCPSPSGSSWPEFKPCSAPVSRPATAEEKERVLAVKIQLKGLDSCFGLFKKGASDDEDEDEEEEDDGDDAEEYDFFMKLFEDDDELKNYYVKNCENGEFYCLVCGALKNKLVRTFKNCVALVQHSVNISKTKKKMAHRGYGHAICKVLGWDVNRLPSLPSTVVDASGQSHELQSGSKVNDGNCVVNDHGDLKENGVRHDNLNVLLEKNNTLDAAQEIAIDVGEGCSAIGRESVDCGVS
ncbi:Elongation factor G [Bienertia sinuspersici]